MVISHPDSKPSLGVDVVVQLVKLPLRITASYTGVLVWALDTSLPTQLLANTSWEAADDGSSAGSSATHAGDPHTLALAVSLLFHGKPSSRITSPSSLTSSPGLSYNLTTFTEIPNAPILEDHLTCWSLRALSWLHLWQWAFCLQNESGGGLKASHMHRHLHGYT